MDKTEEAMTADIMQSDKTEQWFEVAHAESGAL